jgi:hypothetical protein
MEECDRHHCELSPDAHGPARPGMLFRRIVDTIAPSGDKSLSVTKAFVVRRAFVRTSRGVRRRLLVRRLRPVIHTHTSDVWSGYQRRLSLLRMTMAKIAEISGSIQSSATGQALGGKRDFRNGLPFGPPRQFSDKPDERIVDADVSASRVSSRTGVIVDRDTSLRRYDRRARKHV